MSSGHCCLCFCFVTFGVYADIEKRRKKKMNEIVNKFLLAEDQLISEIYLRELGFTYSTSELFIRKRTE